MTKANWIPVTERLPEKESRYTKKDCKDFKVTAWMPLPEPYKESEE